MYEIVEAVDKMCYAVLFHSEQWDKDEEPVVLARFFATYDAIDYAFSCLDEENDEAIVTIVEI